MDVPAGPPIPSATMIRRRSHSDPLGPSKSARWLEIRTMTGALIESHRLPDGDVAKDFVLSILNHLNSG